MAHLLPFQKVGLGTLLEWYQSRHKTGIHGVYNADDPGLGKTITSIAFHHEVNSRKTLVIVPASLRYNWENEIRLHTPDLALNKEQKSPSKGLTIRVVTSKKDLVQDMMRKGISARWVIISYSLFINPEIFKFLAKHSWDLVIIDEAHNLSSYKAKITNAAIALTSKKADFSILLSGTPLQNSTIDLFSQFKIVDPKNPEVRDFKVFAQKWAFEKRVPWGNGIQYFGGKRVEDLGRIMRRRFLIRRTQEEVIEELPEITYNRIEVDLPVKLIKEAEKLLSALKGENIQYDYESEEQLAEALERELKEDEFLEDVLNEGDEEEEGALGGKKNALRKKLGKVLKKNMRNRQILGIAKAKSSQDFIENLLTQRIPIVIFAHFQVSIKVMLELYGKKYNPVKLDGKCSPKEKELAVNKFNTGQTNLFIGQLKAASVGINLQHRCCNCNFLENNYNPSEITQGIRRLQRIGQKNAVTANFILSHDSKIDTRQLDLVLRKQVIMDKLFYADRD